MLEIDRSGFKRSLSAFERTFKDVVKHATSKAENVLAHDIMNIAKDEHPTWKRRTGEVDRSWRVTRENEITNSAPHSKYLMYGTRPRVIMPNNANGTLRFNWIKKGGYVFFKKVFHPGTKGHDWVRGAYRNNKKRLDDKVESLITNQINRVLK